MASIEGRYDGNSEASHRVVHQDGDRVTFRECSRQFATPLVGELFAKETLIRGTSARVLMKLASSSNTNSSSRGHSFEAMMHSVVCYGSSYEYKIVDVPCDVLASDHPGRPSDKRRTSLQTALDTATDEAQTAEGVAPGGSLRLKNPKLEEQYFTGGSSISIGGFNSAATQCSSPCYLRPNNDVHPVIDACIYPDTLLNYKVSTGKAGNLNEKLLEDHLLSLPDLPRYYFNYIVPADVYSTFKPAPLKRDASVHQRVARTHVRVVKVTSKLQPTVRTISRVHHGACLMARLL